MIYGSKYCPACSSLVESFDGYEAVSSIYVECADNQDTCSAEMQTNYVPEIQIRGGLYRRSRDHDSIAEAVDCQNYLRTATDGLLDLELVITTDKRNYYLDEEIKITIEANGFGVLRFNTDC